MTRENILLDQFFKKYLRFSSRKRKKKRQAIEDKFAQGIEWFSGKRKLSAKDLRVQTMWIAVMCSIQNIGKTREISLAQFRNSQDVKLS